MARWYGLEWCCFRRCFAIFNDKASNTLFFPILIASHEINTFFFLFHFFFLLRCGFLFSLHFICSIVKISSPLTFERAWACMKAFESKFSSLINEKNCFMFHELYVLHRMSMCNWCAQCKAKPTIYLKKKKQIVNFDMLHDDAPKLRNYCAKKDPNTTNIFLAWNHNHARTTTYEHSQQLKWKLFFL